MRAIDKLEQKIGKFAISNLMLYLIIIYLVGYLVNTISPDFYDQYLSLSASKILQGQVWRIVTYLCYPPSTNLFYFALATFVYFSLGRSLERIWGTFRFNIYIFIGVIANVIAALVIYAIWKVDVVLTANQLYLTMLLGMAATIPDATFLLFFILPIKARWLGIFYGGLLIFDTISFIVNGYWANAIAIVMSMLNFIIFILFIKPRNGYIPNNRRREFKIKFERRDNGAKTYGGATTTKTPSMGVPHHRCAVCGITDLDNPKMTFRYCSKCAGAAEYCEDHLYTHEHIEE